MKFVLETQRLLLREMTLDDLDFMTEMLGDAQTMRFYPQAYTRADAVAWIERQMARYQRDGHGGWLAISRDRQRPVGHIGLINMLVEGEMMAEVGYIIHHPYQRQGLATEAARAVRDQAFAERNKPYLISLIRPMNHPSRGVAAKLGMRPWKLTLHAGLEHFVYRVERDVVV